MKVKDIAKSIEEWAPLALQESYDNSGLQVGDKNQEVTGILISLDVTEEIVEESIKIGANLIVAHHPLIFGGINNITNEHWVGRVITKALKNGISIYAAHTNLDNIVTGVNSKICEKVGLKNTHILNHKSNTLSKLTTFIPSQNTSSVLEALHANGFGKIGDYSNCSFSIKGSGTYKPNENANPKIGEMNKQEVVEEDRVELMFPSYLNTKVRSILEKHHPYEEAAYFLQPLDNQNQEIGSGMIGDLTEPMIIDDFMNHVKTKFNLSVLKHTKIIKKQVQKIAVCGGSGSFLLRQAISANADVFITADFKYHDYFEANSQILILDIGHYESEVFTKELIHGFLQEKFANIAVRLTEVNSNPTFYS